MGDEYVARAALRRRDHRWRHRRRVARLLSHPAWRDRRRAPRARIPTRLPRDRPERGVGRRVGSGAGAPGAEGARRRVSSRSAGGLFRALPDQGHGNSRHLPGATLERGARGGRHVGRSWNGGAHPLAGRVRRPRPGAVARVRRRRRPPPRGWTDRRAPAPVELSAPRDARRRAMSLGRHGGGNSRRGRPLSRRRDERGRARGDVGRERRRRVGRGGRHARAGDAGIGGRS